MKKTQDYVHSSASNYIYYEGILDVELVDVNLLNGFKTIQFKRELGYE